MRARPRSIPGEKAKWKATRSNRLRSKNYYCSILQSAVHPPNHSSTRNAVACTCAVRSHLLNAAEQHMLNLFIIIDLEGVPIISVI